MTSERNAFPFLTVFLLYQIGEAFRCHLFLVPVSVDGILVIPRSDLSSRFNSHPTYLAKTGLAATSYF